MQASDRRTEWPFTDWKAAHPSTCSTVTVTYNQAEGRWMGWERKRGKLLDLNQLLRGDFLMHFLRRWATYRSAAGMCVM